MTDDPAERPPDDSDPAGGSERDYDVPVDAQAAYAGRFNKGAGRGALAEQRVGYFRIRRQAWDGLWQRQRAGALSPLDLTVVLGLVTRAGYRRGRMGVVVGNRRELADAFGIREQALRQAIRRAECLGLVDELVTDTGDRVGWRFTKDAWFWLTGAKDQERPAPAAVAEALASGAPAPAVPSAGGAEQAPPAEPAREEDWGENGDPFADPSRRIPAP